MSKRKSIINEALVYLVCFALFLYAVLLANGKSATREQIVRIFLFFVSGAIIFGFINAVVHELGHVFFGKRNKFEILAVSIWFFKWTKTRKGYKFSFSMMGNESGYTESVPKSIDNLEKRLVKMTRGGLLFSLLLTVLCVIPYLFVEYLSLYLFCFLSVGLPISAYYFLWNVLPITSEGVLNDGAIINSIKRKTDTSKVMVSLLKIHKELFDGKTPKEIDKSLYFDLPQLSEDDIFFANLLNARYNYYLDSEDYENALKTSERLLTLIDYLPKAYEMVLKTDALFNACFIEKDEEKAEDYIYEVERYINKLNNATNLRVKMAYLILNNQDSEQIDMFYDRAIKEAKKSQLKGLRDYEINLLNKICKR